MLSQFLPGIRTNYFTNAILVTLYVAKCVRNWRNLTYTVSHLV
jgi:hypothetical protein